MPRLLQPTADDLGQRLDRVLVRRLVLSRRQVVQLLDAGAVRLNDRVLTPRDKSRLLVETDRLQIADNAPTDAQSPVPQPDMPLHEIATGPGWLIACKPPGMPVHPLKPGETGTLLNAVIARYPSIVGVGEAGLRSGVVHRLDLETSGLVLFALDQPHFQRFRHAFSHHTITKQYLALAHGQLHGQLRLQQPLIIARHRPAHVRVLDPAPEPLPRHARLCSLACRSVETFPHATLLQIDLQTGFLHQIRAMLAHLGHPLLGDTRYGPATPPLPAPRTMLHATRLCLPPDIDAQLPPPDDFQRLLHQLQTA